MVGWRAVWSWVIVAGMWPTLARARRLVGRSDPPEPAPAVNDASLVDAPVPGGDVTVSLARPEVDRLAGALQSYLGPAVARPDTPARLEAALAAAVERAGGNGRPRVVRRPAGITTPEAWQIRMTGIDPRIAVAIRAATRGRPWTIAP
jgi:hypothetical protein